MKNFKELEVGKSYRNREGKLIMINYLRFDSNISTYPFRGDNLEWYTKTGTYWHEPFKDSDADLIELIEESTLQNTSTDTVTPFTFKDGRCKLPKDFVIPMFPNNIAIGQEDQVKIRRFPSGAIRSDNTGRERFDWISPLALKALAEYLSTTENSFAQINYFKGIPEEACIESSLRHINDFQINGHKKEAVALLFNAVALVHTICLRERGEYKEIYPKTEIINKSDYKEEEE